MNEPWTISEYTKESHISPRVGYKSAVRVDGRSRYGAVTDDRNDDDSSTSCCAKTRPTANSKDHGIEPGPERRTKMPWKAFLAAHWDGLAAADFFTVEVLTVAGLIRYVVLFAMKLKTRTVEIAGITSQPDGNWMTQVARNLTDAEDGFLRGMNYLMLDRDRLYTTAFRDLLRGS
jgi:hypothetical protein